MLFPIYALLYEAFDPKTAHALKRKFEYHYTPRKASWLNVVEIELSIIAKQCLIVASEYHTACQKLKSFTRQRNRVRATIRRASQPLRLELNCRATM